MYHNTPDWYFLLFNIGNVKTESKSFSMGPELALVPTEQDWLQTLVRAATSRDGNHGQAGKHIRSTKTSLLRCIGLA